LKDFYVEIDYRQGPNKYDFFNIVRNEIVPYMDKNDLLVIYYMGHGSTPALWKFAEDCKTVLMRDHISPSEMNVLISSLNYGRCILINHCCGAERLFIYDTYSERDGMYAPNPLKEFVGIASCKEDEGSMYFYIFFMKLMDSVSLYEAFNYTYKMLSTWKCPTGICPTHPVLFCFDVDDGRCEWINYTNPFIYIPKNKGTQ